MPDRCDDCSVVKGWKRWFGTAGFGVFLWAVLSGACGQEALYGMLQAYPDCAGIFLASWNSLNQ